MVLLPGLSFAANDPRIDEQAYEDARSDQLIENDRGKDGGVGDFRRWTLEEYQSKGKGHGDCDVTLADQASVGIATQVGPLGRELPSVASFWPLPSGDVPSVADLTRGQIHQNATPYH